MSSDATLLPDAGDVRPEAPGIEVVGHGLSQTVKGGRRVLHDVSFAVQPGELVAIVGGSGAGKTTLLETLAGIRRPVQGQVRFDGSDLYADIAAFRSLLGYVPQDDIIHAELPLTRTLRYAARLRLPSSVSRAEVDGRVDDVLGSLGLADRANVRVGSLSGGQRKRASIGVELLTHPRVFFLDEPTSGLDHSSAGELLRVLRSLSESGSTVIFTTHSIQDLAECDRVLFLARDGYLAFFGTVAEALDYFNVDRVEQIYDRLAFDDTPEGWARRFEAHRGSPTSAEAQDSPGRSRGRAGAGFLRQWFVLTQRTFETLARNPLTMAILLGSPAMVVAMFAILFRPGAFDRVEPEPNAIAMILFWITFGTFFFGLTYGLLQIVTEQAILRREHLVGQRLSAYLLAKVTVLLPFLLFVVAVMLVVLRALDRLPSASLADYVTVGVGLGLLAVGALALGLLTSAAVRNPAQATLALPMLCFPSVLFSGAILPVNVMATAGAAISAVIPTRWAFESVGRGLDVRDILLHGNSPLGVPMLEAYGDAGTDATGIYWLYLALFIVVFFIGAWAILVARFRSR